MGRRLRFRITKKKAAQFLLLSLLLAFCIFLATAMMQIRPLLSGLATSRVQNTVHAVAAEAVQSAVERGDIAYEELIYFVRDNNGKIAALQSNMAECIRIQTMIVQDVLQRLSQISTNELSIPVGTLTGSSLLAGRGPLIRVRMQSVGSPNAYFENQFTEAGINQTKHQIILHLEVKVSILLPGFTTATKVSGAYQVAETVIVGEVPDSYTYFHSDQMDQMEDYIMNEKD